MALVFWRDETLPFTDDIVASVCEAENDAPIIPSTLKAATKSRQHTLKEKACFSAADRELASTHTQFVDLLTVLNYATVAESHKLANAPLRLEPMAVAVIAILHWLKSPAAGVDDSNYEEREMERIRASGLFVDPGVWLTLRTADAYFKSGIFVLSWNGGQDNQDQLVADTCEPILHRIDSTLPLAESLNRLESALFDGKLMPAGLSRHQFRRLLGGYLWAAGLHRWRPLEDRQASLFSSEAGTPKLRQNRMDTSEKIEPEVPWVVRTGLRFGFPLALYAADPELCHSRYLVTFAEDSITSAGLAEMAGQIRLAGNVFKEVLVLIPAAEDSASPRFSQTYSGLPPPYAGLVVTSAPNATFLRGHGEQVAPVRLSDGETIELLRIIATDTGADHSTASPQSNNLAADLNELPDNTSETAPE